VGHKLKGIFSIIFKNPVKYLYRDSAVEHIKSLILRKEYDESERHMGPYLDFLAVRIYSAASIIRTNYISGVFGLCDFFRITRFQIKTSNISIKLLIRKISKYSLYVNQLFLKYYTSNLVINRVTKLPLYLHRDKSINMYEYYHV
jgi:hypothetical protein